MRKLFWAQIMVLCTCLCLPVALVAQPPCDSAHVTYKKYIPIRSEIQLEKVQSTQKPIATGVEKSVQATKWLTQSKPDFTKTGPWTTTILIGDDKGSFLKMTFLDHGNAGIKSQWLNEKLLFLQFWPGRTLSVDLILDVETERFIYSEAAHYSELVQPCS